MSPSHEQLAFCISLSAIYILTMDLQCADYHSTISLSLQPLYAISFYLVKCSFRIGKTIADAVCLCLYGHWLCSVSLVSIYQIFINYMLDVIIIPL